MAFALGVFKLYKFYSVLNSFQFVLHALTYRDLDGQTDQFYSRMITF